MDKLELKTQIYGLLGQITRIDFNEFGELAVEKCIEDIIAGLKSLHFESMLGKLDGSRESTIAVFFRTINDATVKTDIASKVKDKNGLELIKGIGTELLKQAQLQRCEEAELIIASFLEELETYFSKNTTVQ